MSTEDGNTDPPRQDGLPQDMVEQMLGELSAEFSDDFIADIADTVVDQLDERYDSLGLRSEPIEQVLDEFLTRKLEEVTVERQYRRKIGYLETYLTDIRGVETTDDLTSKEIAEYRSWREHDSLAREAPLARSTLQDDMYLFREFVNYLIEYRLAPERFIQHVRIPRTSTGQQHGVDTKKLEAERARDILAFLRKFEWASVEHVVFELMCEAGPRRSGLYALDVEDFEPGDGAFLHFRHREGTPLKNNDQSERSITLYGETSDVLRDYVELIREPTTDVHGRKPLLTKGHGRIGKSTIQKIAYKVTRPCKIGKGCPHDRNPNSCTAAQSNNRAYECPSSRAPHHIRKGYITEKRNDGVAIEAISDRCDVSARVLKKHYDLPDADQERKRHEAEFRNSGDASDSGYSHT